MYVESARKIKDEFKLEHPEYRYARSTREQHPEQSQRSEPPSSSPTPSCLLTASPTPPPPTNTALAPSPP